MFSDSWQKFVKIIAVLQNFVFNVFGILLWLFSGSCTWSKKDLCYVIIALGMAQRSLHPGCTTAENRARNLSCGRQAAWPFIYAAPRLSYPRHFLATPYSILVTPHLLQIEVIGPYMNSTGYTFAGGTRTVYIFLSIVQKCNTWQKMKDMGEFWILKYEHIHKMF
jgi:hypothetical protein